MRVAVIDIGSPENTGWAIVGGRGGCGTNLDDCVASLVCALNEGPLALGFEAPMFVPMRQEPKSLTKARCGETTKGVNRPFLAGAGAAVLVTSTVVVPYVLRRLKEAVSPDATATLDWQGWLDNPKPKQVLFFEAFVTNQKRCDGNPHIADAKSAAKTLYSDLKENRKIESAVTAGDSFSILGAMMLRTGWSSDISILSESCLVVRPG